MPEIYGFVNGGSPGWYTVGALAEDGTFLASHVCSSPGFGPHDIGVTSEWHHEEYRKHYPGGFRVVWVDEPKTDPRIAAAYAKHCEGNPGESAEAP